MIRDGFVSAYLLIDAEIHDREAFQSYLRAVPALVAKFGGEYLVISGPPEVLEGEADRQSVVLSRWASRAAVERFWKSEEYQSIIPLRESCATVQVRLLEGLPETQR